MNCLEQESAKNQESKLSELRKLLELHEDEVVKELENKLESELKRLEASKARLVFFFILKTYI